MTKEEALNKAVEKVQKLALETYGVEFKRPKFYWDIVTNGHGLRGQSCSKGTEIRLNLWYFNTYGEKYLETIEHELAHSLVYVLRTQHVAKAMRIDYGRGRKVHGQLWKTIMHQLGWNGDRSSCYQTEEERSNLSNVEAAKIQAPANRPYKYACGCKTFHFVSQRMHNNILRGMKYTCRTCRTTLQRAS